MKKLLSSFCDQRNGVDAAAYRVTVSAPAAATVLKPKPSSVTIAPSAAEAIAQNGKDAVAEAPANWRQVAFTAEQLQRMKFEPISWLVSNIIPAEGVTLLCSRPKFGKSWLAYDLCIGATTNRFILGEIKPAQGDVLYLALEDSKRRLKRRMTKLLPTFSGKWPDRPTITTEWRRLHEGGLDDIRAWYEDAKAKGGRPIVVAIDVLAKVRKPSGNKPVFEADYEALTGLCHLARELNIAIVVIHHTRKMAADDLMETVNGSYGITGAVDTVLVMASKAGSSRYSWP
jgi:RecA-family ATPase